MLKTMSQAIGLNLSLADLYKAEFPSTKSAFLNYDGKNIFVKWNRLHMQSIFQRAVHETVIGGLVGNPNSATLVLGEIPDEVFYEGEIVLRFFIAYLYESDFGLNPASVFTEYGGELTGWQAWDFMFKRYTVNPRSDVTGLRSDGVETELFLKELDMVETVHIYADPDLHSHEPLARITAFSAVDAVEIPPRLAQILG